MKCKKCGFEGIEENGDWITCPSCGAKYFNTNISSEPSATRQIEEIESKSIEKKSDEGGKKEEKQKSKFRETVEFLMPIIIAVIVALLLKTFVFANPKCTPKAGLAH